MRLANHRRLLRGAFLALPALVIGAVSGTAQVSEAVRRQYEDRQTEIRQEQARRDLVDFVSSNYWDTAAGRRRMAAMRLEDFRESMKRFVELGNADWATRSDDGRVMLANPDQAEDLQKAVEGIMKYIEREYNVDALEIDVPEASAPVEERVATMQAMVRDVQPGIHEALGGGVLDAMKFLEVRELLARIHDMSRSLRD